MMIEKIDTNTIQSVVKEFWFYKDRIPSNRMGWVTRYLLDVLIDDLKVSICDFNQQYQRNLRVINSVKIEYLVNLINSLNIELRRLFEHNHNPYKSTVVIHDKSLCEFPNNMVDIPSDFVPKRPRLRYFGEDE